MRCWLIGWLGEVRGWLGGWVVKMVNPSGGGGVTAHLSISLKIFGIVLLQNSVSVELGERENTRMSPSALRERSLALRQLGGIDAAAARSRACVHVKQRCMCVRVRVLIGVSAHLYVCVSGL